MGKKDYFAPKAKSFDALERRVKNAKNIANLIVKNIELNKNMHIADFGSGTGLLLEQIAPYVSHISAIDISNSMNQVLKDKLPTIKCQVSIKNIDLTKDSLNCKFDGIISSMTLHHISNIKDIFTKFYNMLNNNSFIAIADLDTEDGSFHESDTGVCHYGFDRDEFLNSAKSVGFRDLKIIDAGYITKPYGKFSLFLLIGKK